MKNINDQIRFNLKANEPKMHSNNIPAEIFIKFYIPFDQAISSAIYFNILRHLRSDKFYKR